jgi:hypothetical protein
MFSNFSLSPSWRGLFMAETQNRALEALETGKVVVLPHLPFAVEAAETKFLAPPFQAMPART